MILLSNIPIAFLILANNPVLGYSYSFYSSIFSNPKNSSTVKSNPPYKYIFSNYINIIYTLMTTIRSVKFKNTNPSLPKIDTLSKDKAYAIAPLNPLNHKTN